MQKRTVLFRPALLALCAACAVFSAFSSGHAAQAEKTPRAEAPEPTGHTQVNLPKSRCPNKLIRKGVFQGAYTGAECGDHCYALFTCASASMISCGWRSPLMRKFYSERCVCAPQSRSAGTSMGPKVSFSWRVAVMRCSFVAVQKRAFYRRAWSALGTRKMMGIVWLPAYQAGNQSNSR